MNMLFAELPALLVLVATALVQWGERRVHAYNYAYLKAVDGEELNSKMIQQYYVWVSIFPWLAFLTSYLLPGFLKLTASPWLGLFLILTGYSLRLAAIRALGRLWSCRCLFVPGMPRVQHGPYRFLKHPEYTGRMIEAWGLACFFGLNPCSFLLWFYGLLFLPKIVKIESRQLYELSVAPLQLPRRSSTVGSSD